MNTPDQFVDVIKLNTHREETWHYRGRILENSSSSLLIEAFFNHPDLPLHGITLRQNDRFIERYFQDRWYNIFEIHDREDDHLKGWYCNITEPAEVKDGKISYVDLALDVLVYPDGGGYLVLDQDEFDALSLEQSTRENALNALDELISIVREEKLTGLI